MNRRDFISSGKANKGETTLSPRAMSLGNYSGNLTRAHALHLLRRLCFAPTLAQVDAIADKTPSQALDLLFGTTTDSTATPSATLNQWLATPEFNPLDQITDIRFEIEGRLKTRYREFIDWWLDLMRTESMPIGEKLTLFLSTIWCIEFTYDTEALMPPPLLYKNNQTLRKNRLAKYSDLASDITLDGAMLLYQSLYYSSKAKPNENYMRELMELFTMGIGNYTEGDIREGARVLTGWRTAAYFGEPYPNGYFETYFVPAEHDTGSKTLFGSRTIAARTEDANTEFQVKEQEVNGLMNILFTERADAIALFVAEKAYKYFVYSSPGDTDAEIISELASVLKSNSFSLQAMYRALFQSEYFYDDKYIGGQIKTPPEYIVGLERSLGKDFNSIGSSTRGLVSDLEQELYDPPNVGSWFGYRNWISTKTYPDRIAAAKDLIAQTNAVNFAKQFANYSDADSLLGSIIEFLLPREQRDDVKLSLKQTMLNGISTANWASEITSASAAAEQGLKNLLIEIVKLPDFQLC